MRHAIARCSSALVLGSALLAGAFAACAQSPSSSTAAPSAVDAKPTLYDELGGSKGVTAFMRDALEHTAENPVNAAVFKDVDLDRLALLLNEQVCSLTGGGCVYKGKSMREAHADMHVDTAQFNALVEDLQHAMDRRDIPFATQNRLLALLAPMHRDVIGR